jgi:tetratricopeptide (TPR) repeat protein
MVQGRVPEAGQRLSEFSMLSTPNLLISLVTAALVLSGLSACSGKQERLANYLKRGEEYVKAENYDKARIEFGNALQIDPNNANARFQAGRIAEKQSNIREAVGNYQAAIDLDTKLVSARAALGRIYLLSGLADKARETIEPALAIAPDDPDLRVVRGSLRAMAGDKPGALEDGEAAVRAAPDNEMAVAYLAAQYRANKQVEEAIRLVDSAVQRRPQTIDLRVILVELLNGADRVDEAEKQLRELAGMRPKDLTSWQRLASFYQFHKRPADVEAALRSAVSAMPESTEAKSLLVRLVASSGGVDKAREQMLQFVKEAPEDTELRLALGQFYESTREIDKAEAEYRSVIQSDGVKVRGVAARDRLAALLVRRNDMAGAESLIAEVLKESPRDNDALILRAGIALSRNQTSAAITDLRAVLRDQPQSQPIMRALARAHIQANDNALAEEVLRAAVQVNPADTQTRLELADFLARSGRPKLAQPMLEQLIRDMPGNLPVRVALAEVLAASGDIPAAMPLADEVKKLQPDQPTGYMLAARLLEAQGKWPQAMTEYEHALRVTDDPMTVITALVRLDIIGKQPQRALVRIAERIEKAPGDARAWALNGDVLASMSQWGKAKEAFGKANAAEPAWWPPYRALARLQIAEKQREQALATLVEGVAKTGGALELSLDLASLQQAMNRHDDAIATYEGMLKRKPGELATTNNLAMLLVTYRSDQASLDRAAQLAEQLAKSTEAPVLDTRGWVKYRRGEYADALPLLREAVQKAPKSAFLQYHLGMAQFQTGDRDGAKASLQAAIAASSTFDGVDEARATLKKLGGA